MACHAARVTEEGGAHALSFRAITPEQAQQGYCAACLTCGAKFKSAVEWLITECRVRPELAGRSGGGR